MTVEELVQKDNGFNESVFLSKANNRIKNLYQSITLNKMDRLQAFMSDSLYQKIKERIEAYQAKGLDVIYDEINVDSTIRSLTEQDGFYLIETQSTVRYLKYFVSTTTGKIEYGDNENRSTVIHKAIFKKRVGDTPEVFRCFGCGTTLEIENNGKCPNCGRIYDLQSFEYILDEFE